MQIRITESQNDWGRKGPLEVILPSPNFPHSSRTT